MSVVVTVGIVARNEQARIEATLRALGRLDFPKDAFEVLLVDGDSSDDTREIAGTVLREVGVAHRILNEAEHGGRGLCFARNLVIDHAAKSARYIAFIDADCIADPNWLNVLYQTMEQADEDVAGAGGARLIAPTQDPRELVINTFITSRIGSGWNPVFSNRPVTWVRSIANYSAIYRRDVLARFRYDESLVVSDDNEVNYRIAKAGYRFRFVRGAKIYHHETGSIREFARNMFAYGMNIANSMRKHRAVMRPFVPFAVGLLGYLVALPLLFAWLGPLSLLPLGGYLVLCALAVLEVLNATRSPFSLMVVLLFPLQHLGYGSGVLANLLSRRVLERQR